MEEELRSRWAALAGGSSSAKKWGETLLAAYGQPWRHYHGQAHLLDCLRLLEAAPFGLLTEESKLLQWAFFFHDAVYLPQSTDNEERSADMAKEALAELNPAEFAEPVIGLIMATKTHKAAGDPLAEILLDIDLAILGAEPSRYETYAEQIRAEYSFVPSEVYAEKRADILLGFLSREAIYLHPWHRDQWEQTARLNLARERARLLATL